MDLSQGADTGYKYGTTGGTKLAGPWSGQDPACRISLAHQHIKVTVSAQTATQNKRASQMPTDQNSRKYQCQLPAWEAIG